MSDFPATTRSLILNLVANASPGVLNDTTVKERPFPQVKDNEVLVKMIAASFNHRELWQKKNVYPGIVDDSVMGCDGAGIVIASSQGPNDILLGKRVFLTPTRGWLSNINGPEGKEGVLGGLAYPGIGTMTEYVAVERDEVIEIPEHLSFEEAAAWPCAAITGWRATFVKGALKPGQNVFITGCGGGVALTCLQLAVAAGANVYVSSGDQAKIDTAISLGAKGGVNYKKENWSEDLAKLLQATTAGTETLDLIIDQGGGDICNKAGIYLRSGGIISCFMMHALGDITFGLTMVLKNAELRGSTLGSRKELIEATEFISKHKVKPIVYKVIDGIDNAPKAFDMLQKGDQMGKIVVKIADAKA